MASISSTQGGAGISQFLHNLISSGSKSSSTASIGKINPAAKSGHHHRSGFEKLANAVTSALQAASNTDGSSATDANKIITEALAKIFQNGSLGSTGDKDSDNQTSDAVSGAKNDGTTAANDPISSLPAEFAKTLKSFGVTAQQFQNDLATALKSAQQNGSLDPSTAFKSFPAGSMIDAVG